MTFRTVKVKNSKTTPKKVSVFEFNSSEGLFICVEELFKSRYIKNIKSDLYMAGNIYRMVFTADKSEAVLLKHYCFLADKVMPNVKDIAYTKEYFKLITKENAVNKIGTALN